MLIFDNMETSNLSNISRLKTTNSIKPSYIFYPSILPDSHYKLNTLWNRFSEDTLLQEMYLTLSNSSNILYNEAVLDFIQKFQHMTKTLSDKIANAFNSMTKYSNLTFAKDKKVLDKYKDEFLATTMPIRIKMYTYTITKDTPNYKYLRESISSHHRLVTLEPHKARGMYKKNHKHYNQFRAKILGYDNKSISQELYEHECWLTYRNHSDKLTLQILEQPDKVNLLSTLLNYEAEMFQLKDELHIIQEYIRTAMKHILIDYQAISKLSSKLTNDDYNAYTTYIYNQLNDLRVIMQLYQTAYMYKIDAVTARRSDYMIIFKSVVKDSNIYTEDYSYLIKQDYPKRYIITEDNLYDNTIKDYKDKLYTEAYISEIYGNNELISEASPILSEETKGMFTEVLEKAVESLRKTLNNIFTNFMAKKVSDFNKDFPSIDEFKKLDLSDFERLIFTYDIDKMIKACNAISTETDSNNDKQVLENMDNVDEFRKKKFPMLTGWDSNKQDWSEFVKSQFRGPELKDPKIVIDKAFEYCKNDTYKANKEKLAACNKKLNNILDTIQRDLNKVKATPNATSDEKKSMMESYSFYNEGNETDAKTAQAEQNAKLAEKNKAQAAQATSDDVKSSLNKEQTVNGDSKLLTAKKNYFKELQTVQGYAWSIFEEGRKMFITYLMHIRRFQKDKESAAKKNSTKGSNDENKGKNESSMLLDLMLDTDSIKHRLSSLGVIVNEDKFYDGIYHVLQEERIEDKLLRYIDFYSEDTHMLNKTIAQYTSLVSNRIYKYRNKFI